MSMKQAREKITKDVERICKQRLILEGRLRELRAAISHRTDPVRGFELEDIERASAAPIELLSRIDGIEKALKKSFFDDPEFCCDAIEYLQEIAPDVECLDTKKREIDCRIDRLEQELKEAKEAAAKDRSAIDDQLDELFSPLGETIYSYDHGAFSGKYIMNKLLRLAEKHI